MVKEQQAREEITQQKEELERRMIEHQEEASRAKEALVNINIAGAISRMQSGWMRQVGFHTSFVS